MLFAALPEANHELVALRPIVEADLPVWYAYLSKPAVFEHTSWTSVFVLGSLHLCVGARSIHGVFVAALCNRASLHGRAGRARQVFIPSRRRAARPSWRSISRPACGVRASLPTSAQLLVAWAHASVGLLRIQATVLESNARSAAVLERCGFVRARAASKLSSGARSSGQLLHVFACPAFAHSHLTPPSSGHPPAGFACFRLPLMSNVRSQNNGRHTPPAVNLPARSRAWIYRLVSRDPEIMSWSPLFHGHARAREEPVRVPRRHILFGKSSLEDFPSVSRQRAVAVLEAARQQLTADAPTA